MTVSCKELENYLGKLLSPELFDDYAPNGLQIEGQSAISKIAFAVSATQESIRASVEWGAEALVVHHGLFWKYMGARTITGPWGKRVNLCIKNNLNLFAYHLPLDGHQEFGNAAALANIIGLEEISAFAMYKKQPMGVKGRLLKPANAKELKVQLEKILQHPVVVATSDENQIIRTVGIITGGANNDWIKAQEDNLDAFITGEISEYNWHDAIEAGVHFFAGGHHATEKFGTLSLMNKIKLDYPGVDTRFFDSENQA